MKALMTPSRLFPLLFLAFTACSQSTPTAPPAQLPQVDQPPISQTVYAGMRATFTVKARGEALSYQWFRNGVAIPGATGESWTTEILKGPEDDTPVSVLVDNRGTRLSLPAQLTVKAPLDLRFKGFGSYPPADGGEMTNVTDRSMMSASPSFGIPLSVGSATRSFASWELIYWWLPAGWHGTGTRYGALSFDEFEARISEFSQGDAVLTSLDLGPSHNTWAFSLLSTLQSGSFQPLVRGSVSLEGLQDFVAKEGAQGRVITAISFGADGNPYVMSYGWSLAPTARFEARAIRATTGTLLAAAKDLSDQGYLLTALGADNERGQGLLLVGTRPEGNAKPLELYLPGQGSTNGGWTYMGRVWGPELNDWIWLVQR